MAAPLLQRPPSSPTRCALIITVPSGPAFATHFMIVAPVPASRASTAPSYRTFLTVATCVHHHDFPSASAILSRCHADAHVTIPPYLALAASFSHALLRPTVVNVGVVPFIPGAIYSFYAHFITVPAILVLLLYCNPPAHFMSARASFHHSAMRTL